MIAGNQNPTAQAQNTTKFGKVVKRKQQHATSLKTKEMFYRTTFVVQTFLIQHDTTTYNIIQQHTTRWSHSTNFFFTTNVVHCCIKSWDRLTGALETIRKIQHCAFRFLHSKAEHFKTFLRTAQLVTVE